MRPHVETSIADIIGLFIVLNYDKAQFGRDCLIRNSTSFAKFHFNIISVDLSLWPFDKFLYDFQHLHLRPTTIPFSPI